MGLWFVRSAVWFMLCARRHIGSGWGCFNFATVHNEKDFEYCRPDCCLDDFFCSVRLTEIKLVGGSMQEFATQKMNVLQLQALCIWQKNEMLIGEGVREERRLPGE